MTGSVDGTLQVLAAELENVSKDIAEIKRGVKNVMQTQSLVTERLTRIEERYTNHAAAIDRAFNAIKEQEARVQRIDIERGMHDAGLLAIKEHEARLQKIEVEQPLTKTVRGWALTIVATILTALVTGGGAVVWNTAQSKPQQVIVVDRDGSTTRIEPPRK